MSIISAELCLVTQSCLTLGDPMDRSPPGSSVHGILQARILEWVATSSCRGSFQPRDWAQVSLIAGSFFTNWGTREAQVLSDSGINFLSLPFARPHESLYPHNTLGHQWAEEPEREDLNATQPYPSPVTLGHLYTLFVPQSPHLKKWEK